MNHSIDFFNSPTDSSILLSVKPRFSTLIVEGSKTVEFRRSIPAKSIRTIAIYASAPIQSIVALVDVKETIEARPTRLWTISKENGGGLTKAELMDYFSSKDVGFAFLLENVRVFKTPVAPKKFFEFFTAPQSFKYLTENEIQKLEKIYAKGK